MISDSGGWRRAGPANLVARFLLAGVTLAMGASGAAAAGEGAAAARIAALAVSPQDGTLWVGTPGGLLRSGDQGRTLMPVALPAKAPAAEVTGVGVGPRAPWAIYVATGGEGILRSEDSGKTWATANSSLDGLNIRGLAIAPNDARLHAQVRGKGLFRSMDGAKTWERVDDGPAGAMYVLASVNISTGMGGIFLYAGTDQGLVKGPD